MIKTWAWLMWLMRLSMFRFLIMAWISVCVLGWLKFPLHLLSHLAIRLFYLDLVSSVPSISGTRWDHSVWDVCASLFHQSMRLLYFLFFILALEVFDEHNASFVLIYSLALDTCGIWSSITVWSRFDCHRKDKFPDINNWPSCAQQFPSFFNECACFSCISSLRVSVNMILNYSTVFSGCPLSEHLQCPIQFGLPGCRLI